jgi:hypothetical protein
MRADHKYVISIPQPTGKPLGSVYIPYVKGVSEKFKRIGTVFRTKHTLRSFLMNRTATDGTVRL